MGLHRVAKVTPLLDFRLQIIFDDRSEFEFDMKPVIETGGVFETLKNSENFRSVFVDQVSGNIFWPNGADLDTQVLYYEDMAGKKSRFKAVQESGLGHEGLPELK